ncbi:MAG: winged helix-turn-helix transcriptional regulator [Deltaproteobacteria bacterium]|nr:MAG: winged helix-turn-helix transcriptional regulator [Deltaproteobacteria bacterium]TNF29300.1 MAG: winged helix-turn-helix transcriptional regulator [Deltaproteobacteria bacterium]
MNEEVKLDKVDREILKALLKDSRRSYQDIASELIVSPGTIHVRLNKLKEAGVITGSKITVDYKLLGFEVCAFIGINLVSAKDYQNVLRQLNDFPEVVEVHYTTGQYSMFIKVLARTTKELHLFLIEKLQNVSQIQSTETFISLDNPIDREGMIPVSKE